MPKSRWIPVSQAAARLCLSREAALNRVQRGKLRGRVTDDGFWLVDADDIPRYLRTERAADGEPA